MNPRLRDLQIQAFAECKTFEDGQFRTDEVFQRFAELIVRECLDIIRCDAKNFRGCDIKTDLVVVEEYNKTFKYIKEHFGVEE